MAIKYYSISSTKGKNILEILLLWFNKTTPYPRLLRMIRHLIYLVIASLLIVNS